MNKFYMVCAWDCYYPLGGLRNIKAVFSNLESAEKYVEQLRTADEDGDYGACDYYEIFSSDELPWVNDEND